MHAAGGIRTTFGVRYDHAARRRTYRVSGTTYHYTVEFVKDQRFLEKGEDAEEAVVGKVGKEGQDLDVGNVALRGANLSGAGSSDGPKE